MTQTAWGQPPQQYPPQQQAPWGQPPQQPQYAQGGYAQQGFPQQPAQAPQAGPTQSAEDFFMGGGKGEPGFDWGATLNAGKPKLGSTVQGVITEVGEPHQQRSFDGNKPQFFEDGSPRMQVAITLQTPLRNWEGVKPDLIPTDDTTGQPKAPHLDEGLRRIFVKGDMQRAIREAARRDLQRAPQAGDQLAVIVDGFKDVGKGNPLTLYKAAFQKGSGAGGQALMAPQPGEQQQAPQGFPAQGAAYGAPTQQPPAFAQQAPAQQFEQVPVVSTATGQPVVHQQQIPAQQAPTDGQVHASNPYAGVPAQPNGAPEGWQPQQAVPGTNPSTLGQGQPPQAPPDFAQQQAPAQPPAQPGFVAPPSETGF